MMIGIDPGTRRTGWYDGKQAGTLRADNLSEMKEKIDCFLALHTPERVAIEDFTFLPPAVTGGVVIDGSSTGKIIGYIEAICKCKDIEVVTYTSRQTKTGYNVVKKQIKKDNNLHNEHEFSAWCVYQYAIGKMRIERGKEGKKKNKGE